MPIKFVEVGTVPTEILRKGARKAIIVANANTNSESVWLDLEDNGTFSDQDETPDTPLAVGVGVEIAPGKQRFIRGGKSSQAVLGVSGAATTIGVTEFHSDLQVKIV